VNTANNESNNRIPAEEDTYASETIMHKRLEIFSHLQKTFIHANAENEIITPLLRAISQQTHSLGASFVPLDDHGYPLTVVSQGKTFATSEMEAWVTYLAAPSIHTQCRICKKETPVSNICPLLTNPFNEALQIFCLHLMIGNQKVGVLNLYLPVGVILDPNTRDYLQTLVDSAALAIDRLRLRKKEEQKLLRLGNLTADSGLAGIPVEDIKVRSILEERSRLAREIHDGLAQILGYIKIQLSQMESYLKAGETDKMLDSIQSSYSAVSEAYIDTREAIDDLHANPLQTDFSTWLHEMVLAYQETFNIKAEIVGVPSGLALPADIQLQLVRIIQESFNNVRKHARAHKIGVTFQQNDDGVAIEISDDGVGFILEDQITNSQHGLRSMQERAALIDADLEINSQPTVGTAVRIKIPGRKLRQDQ